MKRGDERLFWLFSDRPERKRGRHPEKPGLTWGRLRRHSSALVIVVLALLVASSAVGELTHREQAAVELTSGTSRLHAVRIHVQTSDLPHPQNAPLTWGQLFDIYGLPDADIADSVAATLGEPQPVEPRSYRDVPISQEAVVISL